MEESADVELAKSVEAVNVADQGDCEPQTSEQLSPPYTHASGLGATSGSPRVSSSGAPEEVAVEHSALFELWPALPAATL